MRCIDYQGMSFFSPFFFLLLDSFPSVFAGSVAGAADAASLLAAALSLLATAASAPVPAGLGVFEASLPAAAGAADVDSPPVVGAAVAPSAGAAAPSAGASEL